MNQPTLAPKSDAPPAEKAKPTQQPPEQGEQGTLLKEVLRVGLSVLIIGAGVAGMFSFGTGDGPQKSDVEEDAAALVESVDIVAHEGGLDINVDGLAVPFREILVAAEVAGRITFKSDECRTGSFVTKDTPLLRIDKETYELEVTRLERQETETEQNINELDVEIANAVEMIALADDDLKLRNNEVSRQKRLSNSRVGTASEYENSQRSQLQSRNSKVSLQNQRRLLTTRKARLETSRQLAGIMLKKAKLDVQRTDILAPASGVIVSAMAEQDSFVQRGTSLLTIEDTSRVEVRCSLTMDELYRLWQSTGEDSDPATMPKPRGAYDIPQLPVTVTYELAGRIFSWTGELARYDGIGLDEKTRTVPCRVVVTEPENVKEILNNDSLVTPRNGPPALVRGMFVKVKLHTSPSTALVRIPESAVRPGNRVWLIRDNVLTIKTAVVAGVVGDELLVDGEASGISSGDKAIVSPLAEAIDGMAVKEIEK